MFALLLTLDGECGLFLWPCFCLLSW